MIDWHPVASLFPLMGGQEFEDLVVDIDLHGVREPIWTWQGQGIDGRNRVRALEEANVRREDRGEKPWPLPKREWSGQGSLVAFVLSLNLHRRHLSTSQRALLAARSADMLEEEARQRRKSGQTLASDEAKGKSAAEAAKLTHTSTSSVERARQVLRNGSPSLVEAVQEGKVTVSRAASLAELPAEEQIARIQDEGQQAKDRNQKADTRDALRRLELRLHRSLREAQGLGAREVVPGIEAALEALPVARKRLLRRK